MTTSAGGTNATVGLIACDPKLIGRSRQAAFELGIDLHVLAVPSSVPECLESLRDLIASAARCDVVTFESSALSAAQGEMLQAAGITLRPGPKAAELSANSARARLVLHTCGFDVAPISGNGAIDPTWWQHRRTASVRRSPPAGTLVGGLDVVIARRPSGFRVVYPVLETGGRGRLHRNPRTSAETRAAMVERAVTAAISITDGIDATGIVTVEFLVDNHDRPLVNRVHLGPLPKPRSTSEPPHGTQFEDHLRAILDWPLRSPAS